MLEDRNQITYQFIYHFLKTFPDRYYLKLFKILVLYQTQIIICILILKFENVISRIRTIIYSFRISIREFELLILLHR